MKPLPARTLAADLPSRDGEVRTEGWIHRRRRLSSVTFLIVRDRSGLTQVVLTDANTRAYVDSLSAETVVRVVGTVTANEQAPGGVEVTEPMITALSDVAAPP